MNPNQKSPDPESMKIGYYFKAIEGARRVLKTQSDEICSDDLHRLKSVFYVAVERLGMRADRLFCLQRQLREVFSVINMRCDLNEYEKKAALQLIDELERRLKLELIESTNSGGAT